MPRQVDAQNSIISKTGNFLETKNARYLADDIIFLARFHEDSNCVGIPST